MSTLSVLPCCFAFRTPDRGSGADASGPWPRDVGSAMAEATPWSSFGMKVSAAATFGTAIATLPLPGGDYPWLKP